MFFIYIYNINFFIKKNKTLKIKEILQIINSLSNLDFQEIKIKLGDNCIFYKKNTNKIENNFNNHHNKSLIINDKEQKKPVEELCFIKSPMVGIFYTSSSPNSDPFIKKDDLVNKKTIVCIIESMKVMVEVLAECDGVIDEILVKNGEPVEYGQNLFRVKKNK